MARPKGKPAAANGARKAAATPQKPKKLAKKTFLCSVCSSTFFTLSELQSHLKEGHATANQRPAPAANGIAVNRVPNVVPKRPPAGRVVKPPKQPLKKKKVEKFVKCTICNQEVDGVHLQHHKIAKHLSYPTFPKGLVFLCNQCDYRSRQRKSRDRHVKLQHQRDPEAMRAIPLAKTQFRCRFCPHAVADYDALRVHCCEEHEARMLEMGVLKPVKELDWQEIEELPAVGEPLPKNLQHCKTCNVSYKKSAVPQHLRDFHLGRLSLFSMIYLCPQCSYRAPTRRERDEHVREQHPAVDLNLPLVKAMKKDLKYHCSGCTLSFGERSQLRAHFEREHKPGPKPASTFASNLGPKPKHVVFDAEEEEEESSADEQDCREEQRHEEAKEESSDSSDDSEEEQEQVGREDAVKSEEEEEDEISMDEPPPAPRIKAEVQTPLVQAARSKRNRREDPVVFASFSTPAEPSAPLKRPKSEVQRAAVVEVARPRPPTPTVETKPFLRMNSRRIHQQSNGRQAAAEVVVPVPNGHLPPTSAINEQQDGEEFESSFFLMNTLLAQPPVIYYDYEHLWPAFGALPIKVWKAAPNCQVLFLRLKTSEWTGEPRLGAPTVTSSMLRFEAPRNADRDSFVLGFTKNGAEDAAARLLVETNRHTTFSELIRDLVPSLAVDSALLITSDADRQTAETFDQTTSTVQYHVV